MRSFNIAAGFVAALMLAACAGNPDKNRSESEQLVNSIVGGAGKARGTALRCPAKFTRYCSGAGSAQDCTCLDSMQMRQVLGR